MDKYKDVTNFDELIELEYGKKGTEKRTEYEQNVHKFILSEILKETYKDAKFTQDLSQ